MASPVTPMPGAWDPHSSSGVGRGSARNSGNMYFTPPELSTNFKVQPSQNSSNRASTVSSSSSMPSIASYEQDAMVHQYYPVFCQFTGIQGASATDARNSAGLNKARQKLLKLSRLHFLELSTDVYDELQRRMTVDDLDALGSLETRDDIHPKRNQARQKLALLSKSRFNDLATDILLEIERRFPHVLSRSTSQASNQQPDVSFQTALDTPVRDDNDKHIQYSNGVSPPDFNITSPDEEAPFVQRNAKSMAFQSPTLPQLNFDEEGDNTHLGVGKRQSVASSRYEEPDDEDDYARTDQHDSSLQYSPDISRTDNTADSSSTIAQALKPNTIIPTKATLMEETDDDDDDDEDEHEDEYENNNNNRDNDKNDNESGLERQNDNNASASTSAALHENDSEFKHSDNDIESVPMQRGSSSIDQFHHDNSVDDLAPESGGDLEYNTHDEFVDPSLEMDRSENGSRLSRRLSQYDNTMLDAITEEESGFSDAQRGLKRLPTTSMHHAVEPSSLAGEVGEVGAVGLVGAAASYSHRSNGSVDELLKDKDDQIKSLVEEGSRMDDTINKLEAQLNESENVKLTMMEENSRLHLMVGDLEDQRRQAQELADELEQKVTSLTADVESLEKEKEEHESSLAEASQTVAKHAEEKEALSADLNGLREEHRTKLETLKNEHGTALEALRTENEAILTSLRAEHSSAIDALRDEHESKTKELTDQHEQQLGNLNSQLTSLQAETANKDDFVPSDVHQANVAKTAELETRNIELEDELKTIKEQAQGYQAELGALKDRHSDSLKKQNQYSEETANLTMELAILQSKLTEAEARGGGNNSVGGGVSFGGAATAAESTRARAPAANITSGVAGAAVGAVAGTTGGLIASHGESGDHELKQKYDVLKRDHIALEKELQQQQRITEQVQKEASEFLEEMRHLAENRSSLEYAEDLSRQIQELKVEVQEWKSRYSRAKNQLRNIRQSGFGTSNSIFQTGAIPIARDSPYASPDGMIRDVSVSQFQLAMDEFLMSTRAGPDHELFHYLHNLVVSTRGITQELNDHEPSKDETLQSQLAQGNSLVSTIANQLITITRNHSTSGGLSPFSVIDAAASDLSFAVIDLLKLAKIRPTKEMLSGGQTASPSSSPTRQKRASPLNGNTVAQSGRTIAPLRSTSSEVPDHAQESQYHFQVSDDKRRSGHVRISSGQSSSGLNIPPVLRQRQPVTPSQKEQNSNRSVDGSGNSSRYASLHKKQISWDFDAEDPDNTVAELQAYVERKTVDAVDSIQNLLTGIREGSELEGLLPYMKNVIQVTNSMIEATGSSMNQTRNWLLKDKGMYILRNLEDCSGRMDMLYADVEHANQDVETDRQIRQRLAGVSFDMAKCTKELVKTVEEVSLTTEIQNIDKQLQR